MTPPSGCIHPQTREHPGEWYRAIQHGPPDSGHAKGRQTRDVDPEKRNEPEWKIFH